MRQKQNGPVKRLKYQPALEEQTFQPSLTFAILVLTLAIIPSCEPSSYLGFPALSMWWMPFHAVDFIVWKSIRMRKLDITYCNIGNHFFFRQTVGWICILHVQTVGYDVNENAGNQENVSNFNCTKKAPTRMPTRYTGLISSKILASTHPSHPPAVQTSWMRSFRARYRRSKVVFLVNDALVIHSDAHSRYVHFQRQQQVEQHRMFEI